MALSHLLLTIFGMIHVVLPHTLSSFFISQRPLHHRARSLISDLRQRLLLKFYRPPRGLLDYPYEIRQRIYEFVCAPSNGSYAGTVHILLLSKQISEEARETFDRIPHTVEIVDAISPSDDDHEVLLGSPHRIGSEWHLGSIKQLILVLSICGIGKMSPDTFDVKIARNGKQQFRSLRKLIGIWPDVREEPLRQIRLELKPSSLPPDGIKYHADLIRVIRNFKRTELWAETGNCSSDENKSFLLPLVRAFNQARRNWVEEADFENNLLITYDKHELEEEKDEKVRAQWTIEPSDDTSRTDSHEYPPLSEKEEAYIESKMVRKVLENPGISCGKCLAHFDQRKEYLAHLGRGRARGGGRA